jgi:AraC-like DNA-binding protein
MTNPVEIIPGVIFYSYNSAVRKDKVGFLSHHTLVYQVSGHFTLETSVQKISMSKGEVLLIGKNQLGQITKTPEPDTHYETIVICLQEDLLRKVALEEHIEAQQKYVGLPNILIPTNEFLKGYFQSVLPYVRNSEETLTNEMGILKVKEAVKILLHTMPVLRNFLFDFSQAYKMDLEKFMLSHFHYNIPVAEFAELTGRSLAAFKRDFQKIFGMAPRQWLQEKRLIEARNLIENRHQKPSTIYLDLGFESLSHFSSSFKKKFGKAPSDYFPRTVS